MIEFMSSWVKGLGLAIVIVSILEMLLPNNKTKKYVRMVMGIYILFTVISPFVSNQDLLKLDTLNFEDYVTKQTSASLDQSSMNQRIEELYIEELEKDITRKLEEKGYEVTSCRVKAQISDKEEETKINHIKVNVQKTQETKNPKEEKTVENQIVTQIQKIKPVDTSMQENKKEENTSAKVNKSDIQNIKKFLIEEYEVSEKCLEIN